jgi:beta-galactosidase
MWCYYNNADEVELFVNGKSQGIRRKADDHQYHVMWRVTFDPGEVKVVARKDGKQVGEHTIMTAGAPDHIRMSVDYKGKETTFITAEVVDKDGNLCPWADDEICFIYEGEGGILGTDNGCQTSMERFTSPWRRAFHGKCLVVAKGKGSITAKSTTLKPTWIEIK